jgi:hypothetical protein
VRPTLNEVLAFLAEEFPAYAAQVDSPFLKKQLSATAMTLSIIAQDIDRAVPRRLEEAAALRGIFGRAIGVVGDRELAAVLAEEAGRSSHDLRLSALDAEIDRLRGLLVQLQAHVETLTDAAAREIDEAIWRELRDGTERRRTSFLKV